MLLANGEFGAGDALTMLAAAAGVFAVVYGPELIGVLHRFVDHLQNRNR